MPDRLRATDAAFLAAESARAPRQVAVVMILQPGERGFEHAGLLRLIDDRIGLVPRYRQRVRFLLGGVFGGVLGGVATPYWVDDEAFDLGFLRGCAWGPSPRGQWELGVDSRGTSFTTPCIGHEHRVASRARHPGATPLRYLGD